VNFVIAVKECGKAVRLLETMLGGIVDTLSLDCLADLEALFDCHKLNHTNMTAISHGGHNILYGNFARFWNEWNQFEKKYRNAKSGLAEDIPPTKSLIGSALGSNLNEPVTGSLYRSGSATEKNATKITGFSQKVKQKMPWKEIKTDGTRATNQLQSLEKNKKQLGKN